MRPDRIGPLICLLLVLLNAAAVAQPRQETLPNGLRVVVERFPAAPVVAVRLFVHTGSAWEGQYAGCGISHLVEHCADHASAKFTAEQIRAARARLGETTNAFTSKEATWYVYTTSADKWQEALELVADYVLAPALSPETVQQEQATIQHEIQQGEDEPGRVIWDLFGQTLLRQHPARLPIIGYSAALAGLTPQDAQAYHRARYAPENVVLSVVGDLDAEEVLARAREILGAYPPRATLPTPLPIEPPLEAPRETVREKPGLQRAYLILGWRGVSISSPDMYPLDLLAQILGGGETSRLVGRLKHAEGLVDDISAGDHTPFYDAGAFVISATFAPEKLEEVRAALLREVRRVREQGVTQTEADRARQQMKAAKVFSQQTAEGRANSLGFDLLLTGDAQFTERYLERMEKVTPAQVQAAARRYLDPEVYALAVLRPPLPAGPERPAGPTLKEPRSEKITLDNGLRAIINSQPGSGALQVLSATLGGLRLDPADRPGLGRFTGEMLVRGAAGRSRAQIAEALESRGASLGPFSGRNTVGLTGQALAEDAELLVRLWADCLRRPTFPETEVESVRQETLAVLAQKEESTFSVADLLLRGVLFPQHPYRGPSEGTAEAVKAFTRQDLLSAHRALFSPRQTVLVLAGDVTRESARSLVERHFGDWRNPTPPPGAPPLDAPLAHRLERTVHREQNQALIFYGWNGPRLTDSDLPVWNVLFAHLGSHSGQDPLFTPLRSAGLVYAAGAFLQAGLDPGNAVVYAATDPAKATDCRSRLEAAIRGVQEQLLSTDQLARAQDALLTEQALALADPASRAQTQALDELYGLGYDYYLGAADRIRRVTAEQVQSLARQALALDRCAVVETRPATEE